MISRRGLFGALCGLPFLGMLAKEPEKKKTYHPLLGEIQSVRILGSIDHASNSSYVNFPTETIIQIIGSKGSAEFAGFNMTVEAKNAIHKHQDELLNHLTDIWTSNTGVLGVNDRVKICDTVFMLSSYSVKA